MSQLSDLGQWHPRPLEFLDHSYQTQWSLPVSRDQLWNWLNRMETFTKGQVWPYRVEFVSAKEESPSFSPGVFTNHHGPLMNFAGVIGEMRSPEYRDLHYLYGSYLLSFRLIRPRRLQFWLQESAPKSCELRMQLDSWVSPECFRLWTWMQKCFWKRFPRWIEKDCR